MIGRYLRGEELRQPGVRLLPKTYVEPLPVDEEELAESTRAEAPMVAAAARRRNFDEVELALTVEDATREAKRCLRCDLEFTQPKEDEAARPATVGETG